MMKYESFNQNENNNLEPNENLDNFDNFIGENPLKQKIETVEIGISEEDYDILNRYKTDLDYFRDNATEEELESFDEQLSEFIEQLEIDFTDEIEISALYYLLKGEDLDNPKITQVDIDDDLIRNFLDNQLR